MGNPFEETKTPEEIANFTKERQLLDDRLRDEGAAEKKGRLKVTKDQFEVAKKEMREEKLNSNIKRQKSLDDEKIAKVRSLVGLEQPNGDSAQIFNSKEGAIDLDTALGELVLEDHPDNIVNKILGHVPDGFLVDDNDLGEVKKNIRIWITESAGNAARHINYRQNEEENIQYNIEISCQILTEDYKKYLQIAMKDNGVGIEPDKIQKIGEEQFTTSRDNKEVAGNLHAGGHGLFSVNFKNEIASPRGWKMAIQNRNDGERGAVTFLNMPLKKIK